MDKKLNNRQLSFETCEDRVLLAADLGLSPDLLDELETLVEYASIDGTGNNAADAELGSTHEQLLRLTTAEYADGISAAAGDTRPSAREVSNTVVAQIESVVNAGHLSDLAWLWGQFIDHDIDLTEGADPAESLPIEVPQGDAWFDPTGTGTEVINFSRSEYDTSTGDSTDNPRQQLNAITAFLDGSVVYGSDDERADALREGTGGLLKTSEGDLLPFNDAGLANANPGFPDELLFLAGDVRANENAALIAMQTLWVREHNRIAAELAEADSTLTDDELYQQARAIVTAELQVITYNEFLPALLGVDAISDYAGYNPDVDPSIANEFSTAAYRFGHSMLSSELLRLNNDGTVIDAGNLSLSDAFFNPFAISDHGIDSILLGAASQTAQEIDSQVIDDVRNFLFGQPGAGGFDLASLNIQRGRDHGLADYNQVRADLGLEPVTDFSQITSDTELAAKLEELYGSVDDIDLWVGGLAEDHAEGSNMGELFTAIVADQFERIRDGDRFFYANVFSDEVQRELEQTTLADVILRNTDIADMQQNVFYDPSVMFYRMEPGAPSEITIQANDERIRIVDSRDGDVIQSYSAAEVSKVIIEGDDQRRETITIDVSRGGGELLESIEIHGGDGQRDVVVVQGTRDFDSILVDEGSLVINGQAIALAGVEVLEIRTGRGADDVEVADDIDMRVVVDGNRNDRRRDDGPRDNDGGPDDNGSPAGQQDDGGRRDDRNRDQGGGDTQLVDAVFDRMGRG